MQLIVPSRTIICIIHKCGDPITFAVKVGGKQTRVMLRSLEKAQWEYVIKSGENKQLFSSMTSHWREGRGCGATWKQKKSRLVTGGINNSECSISKVEFYEAPEDKVTPERKTTLSLPRLLGGKNSVQGAAYFISPAFVLGEKENLCAQSQNEVKPTPKGRQTWYWCTLSGLKDHQTMCWRNICHSGVELLADWVCTGDVLADKLIDSLR